MLLILDLGKRQYQMNDDKNKNSAEKNNKYDDVDNNYKDEDQDEDEDEELITMKKSFELGDLLIKTDDFIVFILANSGF